MQRLKFGQLPSIERNGSSVPLIGLVLGHWNAKQALIVTIKGIMMGPLHRRCKLWRQTSLRSRRQASPGHPLGMGVCPELQVARPSAAAGVVAGVRAAFALTFQESCRATVLMRCRLCLRRGFRPVLWTRLQMGCLQETPVSLMRRTISPGFRPIRVRRFAKACLRPRWRTTRASKSVRHPSPGRTFRLRFDRRHNSWRHWHMRLPRCEIQRRHPDLTSPCRCNRHPPCRRWIQVRIRRLSRHSHQWMRPWMRTERRPSCKRGSVCSRAYSMKFRRVFRHYRFPLLQAIPCGRQVCTPFPPTLRVE